MLYFIELVWNSLPHFIFTKLSCPGNFLMAEYANKLTLLTPREFIIHLKYYCYFLKFTCLWHVWVIASILLSVPSISVTGTQWSQKMILNCCVNAAIYIFSLSIFGDFYTLNSLSIYLPTQHLPTSHFCFIWELSGSIFLIYPESFYDTIGHFQSKLALYAFWFEKKNNAVGNNYAKIL